MFYIEINNNLITAKGEGDYKADEQIEVNEEIYHALTSLPSEYTQVDGEIVNVIPIPPIESILTPAEKREQEYQSSPLIEWQGKNITVDDANTVFIRYFAENDERATEIQALIIDAKDSIREMYPDEVI